MRKLLICFFILLCALNNYSQELPIIGGFSNLVIDFENSADYDYFGLDTNKCWNISEPNKDILSLGAGDIALFTDTNIYYKKNLREFFTIKLYVNVSADGFYIDIRHKYDFENHKDGGIIEISHDNGETWENLLYDDKIMDNIFWLINFYSEDDTIGSYDNQPGFTGSNTNIHVTEIDFSVKYEERDTMQIRFICSSDSVETENEGWMIEELTFGGYTYEGIEENNNNTNLFYYNVRTNQIEFFEKGLIHEVEIYNVLGEMVLYINKDDLDFIELPGMKHGLYFVVCKTKYNKKMTRKIFL